MATFVDVAHAQYPKEFAGNAIPPMEGVSLVGAFRNELAPDRFMFWEHEGRRAVRHGTWKAVSLQRDGPWQLYNLNDDRTELHDLAAAHPDVAESLAHRWDEWSWRVHVQPYPAGTQAAP
jgi:arylsulfatase